MVKPITVVAQRKPFLNALRIVIQGTLTILFALIAFRWWSELSAILQVIFVVAIFGPITQIVNALSTLKIGEDELSITYPIKTFKYSPEKIISIEFPRAPQVIRIRPVGRRFLAYIFYPKALSNADEVQRALKEFSKRHKIPEYPHSR